MNNIQNYFIHGLVLLDVDGARLNNLCIDKGGINENKTLTKTIKKGRDIYPFCFRASLEILVERSLLYSRLEVKPYNKH